MRIYPAPAPGPGQHATQGAQPRGPRLWLCGLTSPCLGQKQPVGGLGRVHQRLGSDSPDGNILNNRFKVKIPFSYLEMGRDQTHIPVLLLLEDTSVPGSVTGYPCPEAAVSKRRKPVASDSRNLTSQSAGGWALKRRGRQGRLPPRLRVESSLASPSLGWLVAPWLVGTSLQPPPPPSHGFLLRVCVSVSSPLRRTLVTLGKGPTLLQ